MSEVISIQFPDISGDVSAYTAFLRADDGAGTLLNTGGDTIAETGATGLWTFTLTESRLPSMNYFVRVYSGTTETPANLVYDGLLLPAQTLVDKEAMTAESASELRDSLGLASPNLDARFLSIEESIPALVMAALQTGTQVFGHSYLESHKRTLMASGAATLTGAGTGTEVMTSSDSSKTATFTVDSSGNVSAVVWT